MDSTELAGVGGVVLSLGMYYAPRFNEWYQVRTPAEKRLIFAGLLLLTVLVVIGLSCTPSLVDLLPQGWVVQCTSFGVKEFVKVALAAFISSQGTFVALPSKAKPLPEPAPVQE